MVSGETQFLNSNTGGELKLKNSLIRITGVPLFHSRGGRGYPYFSLGEVSGTLIHPSVGSRGVSISSISSKGGVVQGGLREPVSSKG